MTQTGTEEQMTTEAAYEDGHDAGRVDALTDLLADLAYWASDAGTEEAHRPGLAEAIELIKANYSLT